MDEKVCVVKHVEDEGPGMLGDYFTRLGWEVDILEVFKGDPLPESLDSIAGVVILGGPMNVYEEEAYPFLRLEEQFIKRLLAEEVPFLGVCLGGQLLAKASGAPVTKAPREEKGWFEVELTPAGLHDSFFRGMAQLFPVFQWHEDTFAVPEGGALLATGKSCRNQAIRVGSVAYGLQFHLEMTPEMVKSWTEAESTVDAGLIAEEGGKHWARFEEQSMTVLGNFQHLMESSGRVKRTMRLFVESTQRKSTRLWWSPENRTLQ